MKLFDFFKKKKENQPLEETSTSNVENNLLEIEVKLPEQQNETPLFLLFLKRHLIVKS